MSGLGVTALVLGAVWLGVLTLAYLTVVRQVSLLTQRIARQHQLGFSPFSDGLELGSTVPEEIVSSMSMAAGQVMHILLISGSCESCRDVVEGLKAEALTSPLTVLLSGNETQADAIVSMLPPKVQVVRDPEAGRIARLLDLHMTPFALQVVQGTVTGKALLQSAEDLFALMKEPEGVGMENGESTGRVGVPN